jgi:GDPmannose 4,6-dehydratase
MTGNPVTAVITASTKVALIFGISGQDGAYLSKLLLDKGYVVHGTSRDAEMASIDRLNALGIGGRVHLHSSAPTDFRSVEQVIRKVEPDEIYNLSGQSSVGLSFQQPVETLESITLGTLNILETLRSLGSDIRFYNAGSSECFGDTGGRAADETFAFHPKSPYAVAKAAAFWEVANFRDAYGLFACSGILFNHESPLRPLRFVTRKIVHGAVALARGQNGRLKLGNLLIRRDWGWAPEYVDAMWRMLQQEAPDDFVIATGESHSLEQFVAEAFAHVGLDWRHHVDVDESLFRPSELSGGFGNAAKAAERLGWRAQKRMQDVVRSMVDAEMEATDAPARPL